MKDEKKFRAVRLAPDLDKWLEKRAWKARKADPSCRDGIATQIIAILRKAYEAEKQ